MVTKPGIDFGQAEIQAFNNAIAAGEVHYDESAAKQAAQLYQTAIERLIEMRSKLYTLTDRTGFGVFQPAMSCSKDFQIRREMELTSLPSLSMAQCDCRKATYELAD